MVETRKMFKVVGFVLEFGDEAGVPWEEVLKHIGEKYLTEDERYEAFARCEALTNEGITYK